MENSFYNISQVLGITILQSLWQGLAIWFVLRLMLICVPSLSSLKKYKLATLALLGISVWFIYTFINQLDTHTWVNFTALPKQAILPDVNFHFTPVNHSADASADSGYYLAIKMYLPYITGIYLAGLVFNSLRFALNLQKISLIKRSLIPAIDLQQFTDGFCRRLGITKAVRVSFSDMIDVPCMTGYFKPIILLPFTLVTSLSAGEVEAILLHELSHIKRNDYLLNLAQQFINILLFFNPFTYLINRTINLERENSCDDLVVQTTAQPLIYAHALLKLEQTRHQQLQLALAATGKKYHLLKRIERIMKTQKSIINVRHLLVVIVIMTASITSVAWLNPTIKNGKLTVRKPVYPAILHKIFADTTHQITAKKVTGKKKYEKDSKQADNDYTPPTLTDDPQLNKLYAEAAKYGEILNKYYGSKAFQKDMTKKMQGYEYYNRQAEKMKLVQDQMEKEFQKEFGETAETKQTSEEMQALGKKIGDYYGSAAFKQMNEQLENKYGIPHGKGYNAPNDDKDENYNKYLAELQSKTPADVEDMTAQLKASGEKFRARYNSPKFKESMSRIKIMTDSIKFAMNNDPQLKNGFEISKQIASLQKDPKLIEAKKNMQDVTNKINEYMQSPGFRKKIKDATDKADINFSDSLGHKLKFKKDDTGKADINIKVNDSLNYKLNLKRNVKADADIN